MSRLSDTVVNGLLYNVLIDKVFVVRRTWFLITCSTGLLCITVQVLKQIFLNIKQQKRTIKIKIRRFGVFMAPLSRKNVNTHCKLQHLKRF